MISELARGALHSLNNITCSMERKNIKQYATKLFTEKRTSREQEALTSLLDIRAKPGLSYEHSQLMHVEEELSYCQSAEHVQNKKKKLCPLIDVCLHRTDKCRQGRIYICGGPGQPY